MILLYEDKRNYKGQVKLGNNVAKTLLHTQIFPNFASVMQESVFESSQKYYFCFKDANVASTTYYYDF